MSSKALKIHTMGKRENPVLLFLHAFPFSANMWNEQMQHFSENFYCVAPDLPGFGESALPGFPVTFEHYVDSVLNYLKESKIDKAVWCGLSMGGYLALRMIERSPELCRALILCDTKGATDNNEAKIKRWDAIKTLQNNRSEFVAKQWQTLVGETSRKNVQLKTRFEELIAKVSDTGISSGLVALATRTDSMQMLNKIRVSTLIIVGDEDKVTPRADAEALSENISGSKLKSISHAGHLSNLENPASFNKIVAEFLATIKTK